MENVPTQFRKNPFTAAQFMSAGHSFYKLGQLVKSGLVEQVARGIYRASGIDIDEQDQFRISTLRVGTPSAICLSSALAYHHLTDHVPKKIWIMVADHKRTTDSSIKVFRSINPKWKIGIEKDDGFSVTSVERTLVECLSQRSRLGSQIGVEGLRNAIRSKKTTLGKVLDMAKQLGVTHRILPYIEALS